MIRVVPGSSDPGPALAAARREAGLTQAQVAERIGVSRASVSYMETGRRNILYRHVNAYAKAVGLEVVIMPAGEALRTRAENAAIASALITRQTELLQTFLHEHTQIIGVAMGKAATLP